MHISLDNELEEKLKKFAETRSTSKSAIIRKALERLFEQDNLEPDAEIIIRQSLESRFSIPRNYTTSSFFSTLFVLANAYPKGKVRNTWGHVYQSTLDLNNKELLDELYDEIKRLNSKDVREETDSA